MRALAAVLMMGCGNEDTRTVSDSADGSVLLDCDTELWADQSAETQADWMAACVLPDMQALFSEHDGDAYRDVSCSTCHGSDLGGGTYAMPATTPIVVREQDPSSEIYQFMSDTVMPQMAAKLGLEPYDVSTGTGDFSCYDCHIEGD
ncbi:MAG: hypothetical protein P8R54_23515 [Myxococcota bacterium]|nr:hypothetical protein [Myxococcota bacterium]